MNSEIDFVQLSLIKKSKKYLSHCKEKGIDIALSPFCDLTSWINSLGYQKLHLINDLENTALLIQSSRNQLTMRTS